MKGSQKQTNPFCPEAKRNSWATIPKLSQKEREKYHVVTAFRCVVQTKKIESLY